MGTLTLQASKFFFAVIVAILALFAISAQGTFAQANSQINYQGKLTASSSVAVPNGTYNMRFWLLTTPTIATTSAVWTESLTGQSRVTVTNGLFSVMLGSSTPLTGVNFSQPLYLAVEIGGAGGSPIWDGEMSPRKILGTVPAAFEAARVGGVASTSLLRNDQAGTTTASTAGTLLSFVQNGAGAIARFFAGATEVFTILSNGNVGVGTSTPSQQFTVAGNARITGALFDSTNASGTTGQILRSTASGMQWTSTSSLGLSATFSTSATLAALLSDETGSPGGGLAVFNNAPAFSGTSTFNGISTTGITATGTATFSTVNTAGLFSLTGTAANLALGSNYLSGDGGDEGIFIDSTGNVGIGTSTLNSSLSVIGTTTLHGNLLFPQNATITVADVSMGGPGPNQNLTFKAGNSFEGGDILLQAGDGNDSNGIHGGVTIKAGKGRSQIVLDDSILIESSNGVSISASAISASSLTASRLVATNGSKMLVSTITAADLISSVSGTTGTGNLVFSVNPTLSNLTSTGIANFETLTATTTNASTSNLLTLNVTGVGTLAGFTAQNATTTNLTITGALRDSANSTGTLGQFLLSTGTSTRWTSTSSLGLGGGSNWLDNGTFLAPLTGSDGLVLTGSSTAMALRISALRDSTDSLGTIGQILQSNGATAQWISTSTLGIALSNTTGTLAATRGGTGVTTLGGLNTILYTSAVNTLASSSNFVFTGTNFGIGTSTPGATLTVQGDLRLTGRFVDSSSSTGALGSVLTATASGTAWTATSSLGLGGGGSSNWLDNGTFLTPLTGSDGLVLTGSSTAMALRISALRDSTDSLGTIGQILQSNGATAQWISTSTLGLSSVFTTSGQLAALLSDEAGTGVSVFNIGATLSSTTLSGTSYFSGNVGIGTTTPEVPLQIIGGANANLSSGGIFIIGPQSSPNLVFDDNEIQARSNGAANTLIIQKSGGDTGFGPNGANMIIKNSGNVGIGSTSPSALLSVGGNALVTGVSTLTSLISTNATTTNLTITAALRDTANTQGTQGQVLLSTGTSTRWTSTSSLGLTGGAGSTNWSDNGAFLTPLTGSDGLVLTGSSTAMALRISALRDSTDSLGTIGQILQSNGATSQWISTSTLGLGNNSFLGLVDTDQSAYTANRVIFTNSGGTGLTDSAGLIFDGSRLGIGTTSPEATLSLRRESVTGTSTIGVDQFLGLQNASIGATQFGNRMTLVTTNTATTTIVGSIFRITDSTAFGNTLRGLEVQAQRGTNTLGENTAISGFGRTFGVRGTTEGDAGAVFEPAGVYGETRGTTQGNALRGFSSSITTAAMLQLFQDTSVFAGTGLLMNFGNASGTFSSSSSRFLDLQVAGTSRFTVNASGTVSVGDGSNVAGLQIRRGGLCVDNDGSCTASTSGRISAVEYFTGNSDLAEMYFSNENLKTGEIVMLKGGLSVGRATGARGDSVVGVVSTEPGLILGADDASLNSRERGYPIALSGRVPIRLSNENGPIKKGDQIMLSSLPGIGMKASSTGIVVGVALEDFDDSRAYSETYINQFGENLIEPEYEPVVPGDPRIQNGCYYGAGGATDEAPCVPLLATSTDGPEREAEISAARTARTAALQALAQTGSESATLNDGRTVKIGQITMFVQLSYRYLDSDSEAMVAALMAAPTAAVEGERVFDRLVELAHSFIDGVLSIFKLEAEEVNTDKLCIGATCVDEATLKTLLSTTTSAVPTPDSVAAEPPPAATPLPPPPSTPPPGNDSREETPPSPPDPPPNPVTPPLIVETPPPPIQTPPPDPLPEPVTPEEVEESGVETEAPIVSEETEGLTTP